MTRKFLARVAAGAGLGAAALLICAPSTALADEAPPNHGFDHGRIHTEPRAVKPGHKFKIVLECDRPVEFPYVTSSVTGKVWLKYDRPAPPPRPTASPTGQPTQPPGPPTQPPLPPTGQPTQPPGPPTQPPLPDGQPPLLDDEQPALPDGEVQPDGGVTDDENAEGQGGQAAYYGFRYAAWVKLPWKAKPGHHTFKGSCDSHGKLVVLPRGAIDGGDGGFTDGTGNATQAVAGAGMLGAAAVGGFLLIRRRRANGQPA
ncbi:hypothetical protein [Plantactinospora sp. CA-290183]|uniref:hypothetical protein n=1 Tax=Plantactinospora sp. CA-290183 TaxID=3240006 RepID=UPI003D8CC9E9